MDSQPTASGAAPRALAWLHRQLGPEFQGRHGRRARLIDSYEDDLPTGWVYDAALAAMAFAAWHQPETAVALLDGLQHLQEPDGGWAFSYHVAEARPIGSLRQALTWAETHFREVGEVGGVREIVRFNEARGPGIQPKVWSEGSEGMVAALLAFGEGAGAWQYHNHTARYQAASGGIRHAAERAPAVIGRDVAVVSVRHARSAG